MNCITLSSVSRAVRIEVLGPFRLFIGGQPSSVGRPKVRDVLTLLACHPEGLRTEGLIEALWPNEPPKDPQASLRVALTRTRAQLGEARDSLTSAGGIVSLACETDALQMLDQHRDGRTAAADQPPWRGAPLVGFEHLSSLEALRSQLEQVHRSQAIEAARNALAQEQYGDCLSVLTAFSPEATADESIAAMHAQALAGLGRRSEAIAALDSFRSRLRDQGLSASTSLAPIERLILEAATDTTVLNPPSDAPSLELVGRTDELERLAGSRVPIVVVGESGSGKSALLRTIASRSTDAVYVAADKAPTRPLQAVADIVLGIAERSDRPTEALSSSLARFEPGHPFANGAAAPGSRAGLLALSREAVTEFLQSEREATVAIDDAQWLDRGSAAVIGELVGEPGRLLIGVRTPVPEGLDFLRHATELSLNPLGVADIEALLVRELRHVPENAAREIHRRCGGNVLYASLLIQLLGEGQDLDDLPASVLLSVRQRMETLPTGVRRLLELASVFDGAAPEVVLDDLHPGAARDITIAAEAGLLDPLEGGATRFRHALVREAIVQMTPAGILTELHDEASQLLEDHGFAAGLIAEHAEKGATLDPGRAIDWSLRAAQELASDFGWSESEHHAQRGLSVLTEHRVHDPASEARLRLRVGLALRARGDLGADEHLLAALKHTMEEDESNLMVDALTALATQGRVTNHDGAAFLKAAREATSKDLAPAERARLLAALSTGYAISEYQAEGRSAYREAIAIARQLDETEHESRIEVYLRAHLGCPLPQDFDQRDFATSELRRLAGSDPDLLWEAAFLSFGAAMARNNRDLVEASLGQLRDLQPRIRRAERDFGTLFCEAAWRRFEGDLDEAERLAEHTFALGSKSRSGPATTNTYAALMASIRTAQGRLDELLPFADGLINAQPNWPTWHCLAAAAAAHTGDERRVRHELGWLMRDELSSLSPDVSWPAMLSLLTEAVESVSDRRAAATIAELAEPLRGWNLFDGVCIHGRADDILERCEAVMAREPVE